MKHDDCDEDFWFFMWATSGAPGPLVAFLALIFLVCLLMEWATK